MIQYVKVITSRHPIIVAQMPINYNQSTQANNVSDEWNRNAIDIRRTSRLIDYF